MRRCLSAVVDILCRNLSLASPPHRCIIRYILSLWMLSLLWSFILAGGRVASELHHYPACSNQVLQAHQQHSTWKPLVGETRQDNVVRPAREHMAA